MTTSVNLSLTALPGRDAPQPGSTSTNGGGDFARLLFGASREVRAKLASRPENSAAQMFREAEPEQPAERISEPRKDDLLPARRGRVPEARAESTHPTHAKSPQPASADRARVSVVADRSSSDQATSRDTDHAEDASATPWQQQSRPAARYDLPPEPQPVAPGATSPADSVSTAPTASPAAAAAEWFRAPLPVARPAAAPGVTPVAARPQAPTPAAARSAPKPDAPLPQKPDAEHDGVDAPLSTELSKWISSMRLRHSAGASRAEIDLAPPELGRMRVAVSLEGDDLRVEVQTETDEAGAAVRSQLDRLRTALERLGVRVAQLDVQTAAIGQSARGERLAPVRADVAAAREPKTAAARRREQGSHNARHGARPESAGADADLRV